MTVKSKKFKVFCQQCETIAIVRRPTEKEDREMDHVWLLQHRGSKPAANNGVAIKNCKCSPKDWGEEGFSYGLYCGEVL